MTHLELSFFGSPLISLHGSPLINRIDKAVALVALLALQGPTLHRDVLITNLWTGSNLSKAQAALRTAIWRLKDAGLAPWLEIEREFITLSINDEIWIDVKEFLTNLEKSRQHPHNISSCCPVCAPLLMQAVELYRGEFMAGYSPRNATGFDEWRTQFGQLLHNDYLSTLERLVRGLYKQGLYSQAIPIGRRWLAIDPYNEEAHNLIIRSYASSDQRANAIAHYRAYKRMVEKRLNIPPSAEITSFYKHILTGKTPSLLAAEPLKNPTIVLLDIHPALELWVRHGALMEQVIARFTNLINNSVKHCGGRIIKHSGESFSIYFDHGQPLQCAIAIQRLIAETKWGIPDPISARMVITTISKNQTSYLEYSPEIMSCHQLLQSAYGNQIVITEQAMQTLEFPVSSRAHNLGSYSIPGQINPVQVYELVHPHLPDSEHPGLLNLVRSPANLPIQSTRFVGREIELKQLGDLLTRPECRLLTLVGPGGVGKTRLGIEAISQLQIPHQHGIYYVPLATHNNPTTLYTPIAEALNLAFNNPGDKTAQLIEHLQHKQILLLLDNFEHLLSAAPLLIQLLEAAPGLRLMLTSRERLNLYMETIFEVHGLPYPHHPEDPDFEQFSGIKLFIQNARRVSPGFTLRPEDKSPIVRICGLVEGLPLGIELASAWVRAFSCQEIADSIQANLDFVRTTSPDVPTRHRSLRAAFDHSWALLSEESRRTITKLSVFRNGFSQQAAAHLAHATPLMLASYVDKSILTKQSDGRYLMPETLRAYVLEKLIVDTPEYDRLRDIHCEYYGDTLAGMMVKFFSENGASFIKEIKLDSDNIRAALNWALDRHTWPIMSKCLDPLFTYYEMQGRFRDGHDIALLIMKRMHDLVGNQQPDIDQALQGWEGWFSFRLGFSQDGLNKITTHLEYAKSQGNLIDTANTLVLLADAHRRLGEQDAAFQEITQSLEIIESVSDSDDLVLLSTYANALSILGLIQLKLDQIQEARQTAKRCETVLEKSGIRYVWIRLLELQSRIAIRDKRYEESLNMRLQALEIAEDFNDRRNLGILMNNLGESAEALGDLQSAFTYVLKASQISDEIGDRHVGALSNNNLGYLSILINNSPSYAIPYYQKSLAMYRELGNTLGFFLTLRDISRAYLLAHNVPAARTHLTEALQLGIEINQPHLVVHLLTIIARLQAQMGMPARAIQLCSIAIHHPKTPADIRERAKQLIDEISTQSDATFSPSVPIEFLLPTFQSLLAEINP